MNENDRFEILAALYFSRFKTLAPGKDSPLACPVTDEERSANVEQWSRWLSSGQAHEDALAEILDLNNQAENDQDELQTLRDELAEMEREVDHLEEELMEVS